MPSGERAAACARRALNPLSPSLPSQATPLFDKQALAVGKQGPPGPNATLPVLVTNVATYGGATVRAPCTAAANSASVCLDPGCGGDSAAFLASIGTASCFAGANGGCAVAGQALTACQVRTWRAGSGSGVDGGGPGCRPTHLTRVCVPTLVSHPRPAPLLSLLSSPLLSSPVLPGTPDRRHRPAGLERHRGARRPPVKRRLRCVVCPFFSSSSSSRAASPRGAARRGRRSSADPVETCFRPSHPSSPSPYPLSPVAPPPHTPTVCLASNFRPLQPSADTFLVATAICGEVVPTAADAAAADGADAHPAARTTGAHAAAPVDALPATPGPAAADAAAPLPAALFSLGGGSAARPAARPGPPGPPGPAAYNPQLETTAFYTAPVLCAASDNPGATCPGGGDCGGNWTAVVGTLGVAQCVAVTSGCTAAGRTVIGCDCFDLSTISGGQVAWRVEAALAVPPDLCCALFFGVLRGQREERGGPPFIINLPRSRPAAFSFIRSQSRSLLPSPHHTRTHTDCIARNVVPLKPDGSNDMDLLGFETCGSIIDGPPLDARGDAAAAGVHAAAEAKATSTAAAVAAAVPAAAQAKATPAAAAAAAKAKPTAAMPAAAKAKPAAALPTVGGPAALFSTEGLLDKDWLLGTLAGKGKGGAVARAGPPGPPGWPLAALPALATGIEISTSAISLCNSTSGVNAAAAWGDAACPDEACGGNITAYAERLGVAECTAASVGACALAGVPATLVSCEVSPSLGGWVVCVCGGGGGSTRARTPSSCSLSLSLLLSLSLSLSLTPPPPPPPHTPTHPHALSLSFSLFLSLFLSSPTSASSYANLMTTSPPGR